MNVLNGFRVCKKLVFDRDYKFLIKSNLGKYDNMADEEYLKRRFKAKMGRTLDLDNPQTFSEKLQWLKLYDRNPFYSVLVDKVAVKSFVASEIGEKYIIPTFGVWDCVETIDFAKLPKQFVLKCNHNSGKGMCICTNKDELNFNKVISKLKNGMNENYFLHSREWPYKNVTPKIIAEKFIAEDLIDYKFFCFNGVADSVMLCIERNTGSPKFYFFDKKWKLKRYNIRGNEADFDFTLPKPKGLSKMFEIAELLSKGIPFVRVDLYNNSGDIYFGEMTFYPSGGFDSNILDETEKFWGKKLILPRIEN